MYLCMHTHMHMTKTISLADDAYEELSSVRRGDESFSDVARRLARAEKLRRLFDPSRKPLWTEAEAEEMVRKVRAWRDETAEPRYRWP